jgi:hypothetical protein
MIDNRRVLGCFFVSLCIAAIGFNVLFGNRLRNRGSREALALIMNTLSPGDSQERVREVFASHRTYRLRLRERSEDYWEMTMPLEFGATDWCLLVDFDEGKVSAIRMRTSDGIHRRPEAAPDDKVSSASLNQPVQPTASGGN